MFRELEKRYSTEDMALFVEKGLAYEKEHKGQKIIAYNRAWARDGVEGMMEAHINSEGVPIRTEIVYSTGRISSDVQKKSIELLLTSGKNISNNLKLEVMEGTEDLWLGMQLLKVKAEYIDSAELSDFLSKMEEYIGSISFPELDEKRIKKELDKSKTGVIESKFSRGKLSGTVYAFASNSLNVFVSYNIPAVSDGLDAILESYVNEMNVSLGERKIEFQKKEKGGIELSFRDMNTNTARIFLREVEGLLDAYVSYL